MSLLEAREVECRFGSETVVRDVSFAVPQGTLAGLLGPSGCGKTTALRAIAGFHPLTRGSVILRGKTISFPGYTLAPERRRLGMMFQDYALFPHLNVTKNVCFGLHGRSSQERREIAARMLEVVGLSGLGGRYPHELSGGQQQRVALARALAPHPDLLLMDEPFSSLDVELRERLSVEVRDILREQGITGVVVTHDQQEAFAMCEQVGVMIDGQILQWDTPYDLYHRPNSRLIADFIGKGTFLTGMTLGPDRLQTELGISRSAGRPFGWPRGTRVDVLFRPDDVVTDPHSPLRAEVLDKAFKGAQILYTLRLPTGGKLLSLFPSHHNHAVGDKVGIIVETTHLIAFACNQPEFAKPATVVPPPVGRPEPGTGAK